MRKRHSSDLIYSYSEVFHLQVRAVLDEWITLGRETKANFARVQYRPVYLGLLDGVKKVKDNDYHGAKLRKTLQGWASLGM
jgi:hypothetical protein